MNKGDMVEIVDIDKKDKWLVRNKKNLNQVGFLFNYSSSKFLVLIFIEPKYLGVDVTLLAGDILNDNNRCLGLS